MDQKLLDKLEGRKNEGTLRSLSYFDGFADFYSNDYLGLSKKSSSHGSQFGSTGSRLISGNCHEAEESEAFLANFFQSEASLIFNSGYDANIGLFSSIPQKGDTVIYDELIHASVRDGIRLSFANSYSFKHNSVSDLSNKIKISSGTIYIVIESLYSMNGDLAPIKEIVTIAKENNACLIVDEAHSCGVYGELGRGMVDELGLRSEIFARIVTFGKAYGAHGACVLGSKFLCDYLLNFARSFIYTTALPPYEYLRIKEMVSIPEIPSLQIQLYENIKLFKQKCGFENLISDDLSPIQMLKGGDISKTRILADRLLQNKIAVKPIFSPTVKKGEEGIRFCIHAFNTPQEIEIISKLIKD